MLDSVIVDGDDPLTLNVTGATPNEMLTLKNISGLTSAKVSLYTGDFASEGSYYQGRRGEKLTPVITLKMNPNYKDDVEVSDIREMLYRAFYEPYEDSDGVFIRLVDDRKPERYFVGYVEDINTDQFSQSRDVQISMQAMTSYLLSSESTSGFDIVGWSSIPVDYDGSAKCGLQMEIKINTNTSVVTIDINGQKMILNRAFTVGQVINIDTRLGSRAIVLGSTDIMAALDPTSVWLRLTRPTNTIKVYGSVEADGKAVMTEYQFRSQWWGI